MAEGKKSFVAYCDWGEIFTELPDEKAGQLVKHLFNYVNDKDPETDDMLIKVAFAGMKSTLKRDLDKYENIVERNRANGKKGGRPRKSVNPEDPKKPNGLNGMPKKPKKADSDNVSDSVSVSENEIETTINNSKYSKSSKSSSEWLETVAMQQKISSDTVKIFIDRFEKHLITMDEQKNSTKEFKQHFVNWIAKQNLANLREGVPGKSNQLNYGL